MFMQGPLSEALTRISTSSSVKDLYRIMQGPLIERNLAGSPQEPVYARIYDENATDQQFENPTAHTLREPALEMHMDIAQEQSYAQNLKDGKP